MYGTLLEDFKLNNTRDNIVLIDYNLRLLQIQQELYSLHITYPDLCYIDKFFIPFEFQEPPKTLITLSDDPIGEYYALRAKYECLISPYSVVEYKNTLEHVDLIHSHIRSFLHRYIMRKECLQPHDLFCIREGNPWYTLVEFSVSTPISWLFRDLDSTYFRLMQELG